MTEWLSVPTVPAQYDANPLVQALAAAGVTAFSTFILLSYEDVDGLKVPAAADGSTAEMPLAAVQKTSIKCALACYQDFCRNQDPPGSCNPTTISRADFGAFRVDRYQPGQPLLHWSIPHTTSAGAREVENFTKAMKPNPGAFKDFKDSLYWVIWKEHFEATLDAQGLSDTIADPTTHAVTNPELDERKRKFVYKVMQDVCKES